MSDRVPGRGTKYGRTEAVRAKLEALDLGGITGRLTPEQVATEYGSRIEQGLISLII